MFGIENLFVVDGFVFFYVGYVNIGFIIVVFVLECCDVVFDV